MFLNKIKHEQNYYFSAYSSFFFSSKTKVFHVLIHISPQFFVQSQHSRPTAHQWNLNWIWIGLVLKQPLSTIFVVSSVYDFSCVLHLSFLPSSTDLKKKTTDEAIMAEVLSRLSCPSHRTKTAWDWWLQWCCADCTPSSTWDHVHFIYMFPVHLKRSY